MSGDRELLSITFLHSCAITLHTVSGLGGLFLIGNSDPRLKVYGHYVELTGGKDTFTQTPRELFTVRPVLGLIAVEFVTALFHCIYLHNSLRSKDVWFNKFSVCLLRQRSILRHKRRRCAQKQACASFVEFAPAHSARKTRRRSPPVNQRTCSVYSGRGR